MTLLSVRFCNKQAEKAFLDDLPKPIQKTFFIDIDAIRRGKDPVASKVDRLSAIDSSVIELKINGRPAFRCVYVIKAGELIILHAFVKTTNGPDKKNIETARLRYKSII